MMEIRRLLVVICVGIASFGSTWQLYSQDLPNPDFESYSTCPDGVSQITRLDDWFSPTDATTDYYNHACGYTNHSANGFPLRVGNPSSGDGVVGIYATPSKDAREGCHYLEYVAANFSSPLTTGCNYQISFDLRTDTTAELNRGNDCWNFGFVVYNTTDLNTYPDWDTVPSSLCVVNQVYLRPDVADFTMSTVGVNEDYTTHSSTYTANGGENRIIIGAMPNAKAASLPVCNTKNHGLYLNLDNIRFTPNCCATTLDPENDADGGTQGDTLTVNVLGNDNNPQGDVPVIVSGPTHGSAQVNGDGTISYFSSATHSGTDQITYQICDRTCSPEVCLTATVSFVMNADSTPPTDTTVTDTVVPPGPRVIIPDAFTPNNDGKNDVFVIDSILSYPEAEIWIYTRWGALVYNKKGYEGDWDGSLFNEKLGSLFGGDKVPDGSYFYVLNLNSDQAPEAVHTGFILIQRE